MGLVIVLVFFGAMGAWFTYDRRQCRAQFAKVTTAYDSLMIANAKSCDFALENHEAMAGRFEERCHTRGGHWLDKPIQVGATLTRCIVGPQAVPLSSVESPR